MIKKIKFNKRSFNFKKIVDDYFIKKYGKDSENLHKLNIKSIKNLEDLTYIKTPIYKLKKNFFDVRKDQDLPLISEFYKIDTYFNFKENQKKGKFIRLYFKLIKYLEKKVFKEKIIFQNKPTLRLHFPNTISVGGYHFDSDYGHQKGSVNFWMPFTNSMKTATLWIETKKNKRDYKPRDTKWGEILTFDSDLKHGIEVNKEEYTRASMDFRIICKKNYKNSKYYSPKNKISFTLGNYYTEF